MIAYRRDPRMVAVGRKLATAGAVAILWAASGGSAEAGSLVGYASDYPAGSILISRSARKLYLIVNAQTAIAYPVAIAKPGK